MNNMDKFSLSRCMLITKKIVLDQPRTFLMLMLMLVGILTIAFVFVNAKINAQYYESDFSAARMTIYVIFVLTGSIFSSISFSDLKTKLGRTSSLMLPALASEKYFARFIITVPFFIVAFFIAVIIADFLRIMIVSLLLFVTSGSYDLQLLDYSSLYCDETSSAMAIYFISMSFYWLGSVLWPKNSFIKTFAAMSLLQAFYSLALIILYHIIIGNRYYNLSFLNELDLSPITLLWCIAVVFCTINYGIAYMRLKETEIVQKLL